MTYTSKLLKEAAERYRVQYGDGDNGLVDASGCCYGFDGDPDEDPAIDYLAIAVFKFCGCGLPEAALAYVLEPLVLIEASSAPGATSEVYRAARAWGTSEGERYFMWYRLDDLGLTEHGSSEPGWLTDEGRDVLEALREVLP